VVAKKQDFFEEVAGYNHPQLVASLGIAKNEKFSYVIEMFTVCNMH